MFGGVFAWSKILYENNISRKENEYMEETALKWSNISDAEKKELIAHLTSNLKTLRAKGNLTQEDIANAIGISRQTYSMIECQKTPMA